jgi:hypothetical protein
MFAPGDAGQKTSDRRIAMTFSVAQIFLPPLYYYVYIYSKTHSTYTHDDMTIYRPRLVLAPVSPRRSNDDPQLFSPFRKIMFDIIHKRPIT